MIKLLFIVLFISTFPSFAISWNQTIPIDEVRGSVNERFLVNDRIILQKVWRDMVALESYNPVTNETETLIEFAENQRIDDLIKFNDKVYFLFKSNTQDNAHRLWKTDGTSAGTVQISNLNFYGQANQPAFHLHENIIFTQGDQGSIIELDGENTVVNDINLYWSDLTKMCVFGTKDFIVQDDYSETLSRVTNGSTVDLTDKLPSDFFIQEMAVIDNDCYIQFSIGYDFNAPVDVLKITFEGESQLFSESESFKEVYRIFELNNQNYVFRKNTTTPISSSLIKLNTDGSLSAEMLTFEGGLLDEMIKTRNRLLIALKPNNHYEDTRHYLIDENLNYQLTRSGSYIEMPDYKPTINKDFIIYSTFNSSNHIDIIEINETGEIKNLKSKGFNYYSSVSSEFSHEIYFHLTDVVTNLSTIFRLNEVPKIGISINGIWHNPELKNQGFFIKQGIRNNNSTYLFISLYTFRNGEPLWLAGNADYSPNQESITINLSEYYGANFLEYLDETLQSEFGQVTLEMKACNQLKADLIHQGESRQFDLYRIDNTTFDKYCLEQINSTNSD